MRANQGMSLGTTMLVVLIVSTLAFCMAAMSVAHLGLTTHRGTSVQAENLARSAVAQGIERVLSDTTLGTSANLGGSLQAVPASGDGVGVVTFDPTVANSQGIPVSTNNLAGTSSVQAPDGTMVPAQALRIVGVGSYHGTHRQVDAILHVPEFPYGILSSGPIQAPAGMVVAGVPKGTNPQDLLADTTLASAQPVDIQSNSADPQAISLGAGSLLAGSARAVGGIQLATDAQVRGEVKPHAQLANMPSLSPSNYDPKALGRTFTNVTSFNPSPTISGVVRCPSPGVTVNGNLTMQGGLLYVDGNLTITGGGLVGQGLVAVSGNVVMGGADFQAANKVALIAGGDLSVRGQGKQSSQFQGLIYTGGALDAQDVSLVGLLIVNPPADSGKGISLQDCAVLHTDLGAITITTTSGQGNGPLKVSIAMNPNTFALSNTQNGQSSEIQQSFTPPVSNPNPYISRPVLLPGNPQGGQSRQESGDVIRDYGNQHFVSFNFNGGGINTNVNVSVDLSRNQDGNVTVGAGSLEFSDRAAATDALVQQLQTQGVQVNNYPGSPGGVAGLNADLSAFLQKSLFMDGSQNNGQNGGTQSLSLDPSTFLKLEDRIQLRRWREL